jgi:cytochrome c553
MRRSAMSVAFAGAFLTTFALLLSAQGRAQSGPGDESRIQEGFRIAPVPLNLHGKNRALVGLGSYLVNAVASCADCHSCPTYKPGHNPYVPGGDGQFNGANYLAGGVAFGPFLTSANLTPDASGLPEQGNTFEKFLTLIRTGHDPDEGNRILQVMPWPVLRHMTDRDLRAIYEYLGAIPTAAPGTCAGPGT